MSGINKVILLGRLGADPKVSSASNGANYANFSVATSERYKTKDGEVKEITEWHNVVAWRGLADIAGQYLKKGHLVYVEGKLQTRSYEKDGVTRYTTDIVANSIELLEKKIEQRVDSEPPAMVTSEPNEPDLPF
jgi:single-strand DNA-binding protein